MKNKKKKIIIKSKTKAKIQNKPKKTQLPNGVSESEFLTVLDNISKRLCHKFRFGYHDIEDMNQQAAIFAMEGLEKYDNSRPLENFLWTHVRNRLFNYKRNNYQRPDKPCLTCPLYDKAYKNSINQCSKYKNKSDCELYHAWATRNDAKKNIMQPSYIEPETHSKAFKTNDFTNLVQDQEIIKFLDENIQSEYRESYLKLKHDTKIPKQQLIKLQKHILELMETSKWQSIMPPKNEDN